ncbi:MAG: hypothetical protein H0V71_08575 [Chloroflexi bacterium]|nr:hypothetical protein [Chloroflexota bacterium]
MIPGPGADFVRGGLTPCGSPGKALTRLDPLAADALDWADPTPAEARLVPHQSMEDT